jgi:hypothetical protein
MSVGYERKIADAVRQELRAGPRAQDDLIEALQRRGMRVDPSSLYLACTNHGIAQFDARDKSWTAIGGSVATPTPPASPGRALTAQERTAQRADAQVRRLLVASGVSETGEKPLPGPVPAGWSASAKEAARALLDELHAVSKRRVLTDIPLVDGVAVNHTAGPRLMRFGADGLLMDGSLVVEAIQRRVGQEWSPEG